jgi:hypothetical protein
MTRRQLVGRILLVLLVLVVLAGAGYGLYRLGYVNGVADASDEHVGFWRFSDGDFDFPEHMLENWPWAQLSRRGSRLSGSNEQMHVMPFTTNQFPATQYSFNRFSYFSLSSFFLRLICLGFFVWAGYTIISAIFGGRGWNLSFEKLGEDEKPVEAKSSARKKS